MILTCSQWLNYEGRRSTWSSRKAYLKAPSAAAIRQLTTDHSLGLGVDFTEGGKPSKHGRDQLQQLYSHEFQVPESTRDYNQVVTHPAITPSDQA